ATATGIMRVLNNRHWISDVIAGAGLGILSTELGYWIADMIYKEKGICRYERFDKINEAKPSFFDIQMGVGMHSKSMTLKTDGDDLKYGISLGTSTVVGVEGAYFFNKYVGVGGMLRTTTTPMKNAGFDSSEKEIFNDVNEFMEEMNIPGIYSITNEDNNFVDASADAGVYFNYPISKHFSVGAKALCGARFTDGVTFTAKNGFRKPYCDEQGNQYYTASSVQNAIPVWMFVDAEDNEFPSNDILMPGVSTSYNYVLDEKKYISEEYDMMKVTGGTSFNAVFGLSFTYRYKNNFSWKVFADYDITKSKYTYSGQYMGDDTMAQYGSSIQAQNPMLYQLLSEKETGSIEKNFNLFTIGAAFEINF
ncbi:MAG: hypothetical protein Q4F34_08800, partial [Prevotellaceae bacterium]|nr:hypothetical protein [Prevotellaceae bacterium]